MSHYVKRIVDNHQDSFCEKLFKCKFHVRYYAAIKTDYFLIEIRYKYYCGMKKQLVINDVTALFNNAKAVKCQIFLCFGRRLDLEVSYVQRRRQREARGRALYVFG